MILSNFAVVALIGLLLAGLFLLAAALWKTPLKTLESEESWERYRFGFVVYSLIFLAFDMEMIFMYPWAVVFAGIGMTAFLDMFVFIGLLSAGIAYAWSMGGLKWE